MNHRPEIILLLCRCRTGSTSLVSALGAHPEIASFPEILNGSQRHSYQRHLVHLLENGESHRHAFIENGPLFALGDYIEHLWTSSKRSKEALRYIVLETKIENLWTLSNPWTHPSTGIDSIGSLQSLLKFAGTVLFLRRRDVVARYCSDYVARETKVFHATDGNQDAVISAKPFRKIRLGANAIDTFAQEMAFDRKLFAFIKRTHPKSAMLEYEKIYRDCGFTDHLTETLKTLLGGVMISQPPMGKVRSITEEDIIENYSEVTEAIRNITFSADIRGSEQKQSGTELS